MKIELEKSNYASLFAALASKTKDWTEMENEEILLVTKSFTIAMAQMLDEGKTPKYPVGYKYSKGFIGDIYFAGIVEYKPDDKSWKFYYITDVDKAPEGIHWIDTTSAQCKEVIDKCLFDIARLQFDVPNAHEFCQLLYAESIISVVTDNLSPDVPVVDVTFDDLLIIHAEIDSNDEPIITITPGGELKQIIKGSDDDK